MRLDDLGVLEEATRLLRAGQAFAVCTVVRTGGSTPRKAGAKMLVRADGTSIGSIGGGRIEHQVIEVAMGAMREGGPRVVKAHLVRDLAMCCGGEMEVLVDPLSTPQRVVVCGGGHVARALAPVLSRVGFEVLVCDELEGFATRERFAEPVRLSDSFDPADWRVPLDEHTSVIIATRDHALDQRLVETLIEQPLGYLGCIGSRGKLARFRKRLEAKGIAAAALDRVRGPIGLPIGAETPEEIALSVAAELVQLRAERRGARGPSTVTLEEA